MGRSRLRELLVTPEVDALIDRVPKPVGSFGYDPWGYNAEALKRGLGVAMWLYRHYFRVEAHGLAHVPARGRVLVIANHSGNLPIDGALIAIAMSTNPHGPRAARAMAERFLPTIPFVGNLLNSWGAVLGDPVNCVKMLKREEAVIVFPEGVRGSGKPFARRYRLQRFGHGFMHIAMTQKTPIVPVGVVGCEEMMPSLGNLAPLARLLRTPYFPIMLPLPLPARVSLNFGPAMHFDGEARGEAEVGERVATVREAIRGLIDRGLARRESIF